MSLNKTPIAPWVSARRREKNQLKIIFSLIWIKMLVKFIFISFFITSFMDILLMLGVYTERFEWYRRGDLLTSTKRENKPEIEITHDNSEWVEGDEFSFMKRLLHTEDQLSTPCGHFPRPTENRMNEIAVNFRITFRISTRSVFNKKRFFNETLAEAIKTSKYFHFSCSSFSSSRCLIQSRRFYHRN